MLILYHIYTDTVIGFPTNLEIRENMEKSFTFSSQGNSWNLRKNALNQGKIVEFEKECFKPEVNQGI